MNPRILRIAGIVFLLALIAHNVLLQVQIMGMKELLLDVNDRSNDIHEAAGTAAHYASESSDAASAAYHMAEEARDYAADASDNAYFKHCSYCAD